MGVLTDLLVKKGLMNRDTKFWITIIIDVVIIFVFIFLALNIKAEWQRGFDECFNKACAYCYQFANISKNQSFPSQSMVAIVSNTS